MSIKIGIDITYIPKFKKTVERSGDTFLKRVFNSAELQNRDVSHLAGVFAAKEALIKTSIIPLGGWDKIEIGYGKSGRPKVGILDEDIASKIGQLDISISHDGDYATAVAVVSFTKS